jgi:hypothetical protein
VQPVEALKVLTHPKLGGRGKVRPPCFYRVVRSVAIVYVIDVDSAALLECYRGGRYDPSRAWSAGALPSGVSFRRWLHR